MRKVHVLLPERMAATIDAVARGAGRSSASVIREGLSEWIARREQAMRSGDPADRRDVYFAAEDLVSVAELAGRAGRPISTIQTWRRRYDTFPQPLARLSAGPVWAWGEVERWMRRHVAGETRRRGAALAAAFPPDLPGADLVLAGLADLAAGRDSIEAALVSTASRRLSSLGVALPVAPIPDAPDRLYELVEESVGESAAHGRYNALRRRLVSFLHALAVARAHTS